MAEQSTDPLIGKILGDYVLVRLIAKGGMGRVYEGTDNELHRKVAIKVITLDEEDANEIMDRFQREARVIGLLDSHPNIITIYRYGKEKGVHYIAMKLVQGYSLANYMRTLHKQTKLIPLDETLRILKQVAGALDYAHAQGVIHRDVKPANIMLEEDPTLHTGVKKAILMDFGLVRRVDSTITTGTAFGTPRYIAPEQAISSLQASLQSDVYSLGVVTFEMLTGKPPFADGETPLAVALSHVTQEPPSPQEIRPDLPDAVVPVIRKVLEKKPENRYQRAGEFVDSLEKALFGGSKTDLIPAPIQGVVVDERRKTSPPLGKKEPPRHEEDSATILGRMGAPSRDYIVPSILLLILFTALLIFGFVILKDSDKDNPTVGETTEQASSNQSDGGETSSGGQDEQPTPKVTAPTEVANANVTIDDSGQLELSYAGDILTVRNPTTSPLVLTNVELRNGDKKFSLRDFGTSSLGRWDVGMCAYVALLDTDLEDTFEPPAACLPNSVRFPLRYANDGDFAWSEGDSFEVYQDDHLLGKCDISDGSCTVSGVKQVSGS